MTIDMSDNPYSFSGQRSGKPSGKPSGQPSGYCAVGLSNPKSPGNVGSVLRACGCFLADHIYYTGSRYDRAERFYTDTANRSEDIPLTRVDNLLEAGADDLQIVCIELCENATSLNDFVHPDRANYLFGPEDHSLSQSHIDAADHVVFIPTQGCLNLAASVNVVLYDRMVKRSTQSNRDNHNNMIRNSRDCRNNLKARHR